VNDAGAFRLANVLPGDDAVQVAGRLRGGPFCLRNDLGDVVGEPGGVLLGRQLVEWAVIGQPTMLAPLTSPTIS